MKTTHWTVLARAVALGMAALTPQAEAASAPLRRRARPQDRERPHPHDGRQGHGGLLGQLHSVLTVVDGKVIFDAMR